MSGTYSIADLLSSSESLSSLIDPEVAQVAQALGLPRDGRPLASACLGDSLEAVDKLLKAGILPHDLPPEQQEELARRLDADVTQLPQAIAAHRAEVVTFLGLPVPHEDPPIPVPTDSRPAYPLFPHQRRALMRVLDLIEAGESRAVLHMPTGAGKTRTAMNLICDQLRRSDRGAVLWLASTQELLEQAAHEFATAWGHLGNREVPIHTAWGGRPWDPDGVYDGLLVASPQTLYARLRTAGPSLLGNLGRRLQLIVFDEAHQAIADTFQDVTERLSDSGQPVTPVVGLTATPGRTFLREDADEELAAFFHHNKITLDTSAEGGSANPVRYLIEHGYLAEPEFELLGELPDDAAVDVVFDVEEGSTPAVGMDRLEYLTTVVGATTDLVTNKTSPHRRVLVFAGSVDLAIVAAAAIRAAGIRAEAIHANTDAAVRDTAIRNYKAPSREPRVLVNFGVLTTGFDAPQTSAAVIARPTRSLVLYSQMVGRAIRGERAGGNKTAKVVTVVDPTVPAFGSIADAFEHWEDHWG